jgi:hypothetical protein
MKWRRTTNKSFYMLRISLHSYLVILVPTFRDATAVGGQSWSNRKVVSVRTSPHASYLSGDDRSKNAR